MLSKIKELADDAVKLQNKNRMDEVLREISAICNETVIQLNDVDVLKSNESGFGLAPLRKEGCAVHPDEMNHGMKDSVYKKQAIKYMESTGDYAVAFARNDLITDEMRKGKDDE